MIVYNVFGANKDISIDPSEAPQVDGFVPVRYGQQSVDPAPGLPILVCDNVIYPAAPSKFVIKNI